MKDGLRQLNHFLAALSNGPIADDCKAKLKPLVAQAWRELSINDHTNMLSEKLIGRMETPSWEPPNLYFAIERHGQTVNGSSRATVYT